MLALAVRNTKKLVRQKVKDENVRIGNQFTKIGNARLMASMINTPYSETVSILDPCAGTGILSVAAVEQICKVESGVREIELVCYENNPCYVPVLKDNLERVRKKCKHDYNVRLRVKTVEADFVLKEKCETPDRKKKNDIFEGFDIVIMNPPTNIAEADSLYAAACPEIVTSSISEAYIFMKLSLNELKQNGQMVAYVPISFAFGTYMSRFRNNIFSESYISGMHIFVDKAKDGKSDDTVRKNLVIKLIKNEEYPENTFISTSYGDEFEGECENLPPLPYEFVVRGEGSSVTIVKNTRELKNYIFVASLPNTVSSLRLRIRTGLTLESRYPEFIEKERRDGYIPLITPAAMRSGYIDFSRAEKYIKPIIPSLAQPNKNMLLIKRAPAKCDGRHLVCSAYMASQFYGYDRISTHNKLNYLDREDDEEIGSEMLLGLYALFSSTLYERYCRVAMPGNMTNVGDFSEIPLPEVETIKKIGMQLSSSRIFSSLACDNLVNLALNVPAF